MAGILINGNGVRSQADLHQILEAQLEFGELASSLRLIWPLPTSGICG